MELNAAETLALKKILTDKVVDEARAAIDPEGEHFTLDFTVRVTGSLEVEEMQYNVPHINTLQPWQLLKAAMDGMNEVEINAFVRKALAMSAFDDKNNAGDKILKARTVKAYQKMAASTMKNRNGKVVASGLTVRKVK